MFTLLFAIKHFKIVFLIFKIGDHICRRLKLNIRLKIAHFPKLHKNPILGGGLKEAAYNYCLEKWLRAIYF